MQAGKAARLLALLSAAALGCSASPQPAARSAMGAPAAPPPRRPAPRPVCSGSTCVGWSAVVLSGGRDREQNAVAHERNVAFTMRTLASQGIPRSSQALLFADGDDPEPDVQLEEPDVALRRALLAAGLLLTDGEQAGEATLRYRDHTLPGAEPATRDRVLGLLRADAERAGEAFTRLGSIEGPGPGQRPPTDLFFYVTDHGLKRGDATNNAIVLWGRRDLTVRDLGAALDKQPVGRRVVTVMAQCFSGSFAALVHEGGDPTRPLAAHDRCGFFAAPADRPAAGCSPKGDEALYDDYTTRFFAALGGVERGGAPSPDADADADGRVSFEEAHYAAIALEKTQDVPVSTSEELLRRSRPAWIEAARQDARPIRQLLEGATAPVTMAAAALVRDLGLPAEARMAELITMSERARAECWPGLCEAEEALGRARAEAHRALRRAAQGTTVPRAHPAILVAALGRPTVERWISASQPHFDEVIRLEGEVERLRTEAESHDGRVERLRRIVELRLAEQRLEGEAGPLRDAFAHVRACERSGLWERNGSDGRSGGLPR